MKKRNLLFTTAIASIVALSVSSNALADSTIRMGEPKPNQFWWPDQLNLGPLRDHDVSSNPYGDNFDYVKEFKKLDLAAVKKDINAVLTNSQDWWPADYGNYGPFFIRMAWHSAGTYRTHDGRGGAAGGQQRFDPLNSWPDNGSLDKARRLLWPVKQKYGKQISWGDLMVLTGNVAMENMGFKTFGFAGGRADDWEPDFIYWGPETKFVQGNKKRTDKNGKLKGSLAAMEMGLIYVNPEGPNRVPDPIKAAASIRESFGRMAMNDEEIVALIAGGHTFGKAHGAHKVEDCVGAAPGGAPIEQQGFGWKNKCGKGNAEDTITSGLEGAWTSSPAQWTHMYLENLFNFEWKKTKSPAGATQWIPTDASASNLVPDAHVEGKYHAPIMFTTDISLKKDPEFRKIAERFLNNPEEFETAFAKAWFKLTHRDMGPKSRYIGSDVPSESFIWQDPVPEIKYDLVDSGDIRDLKNKILESGLTIPQLVRAAWASAATYRDSDMRGGTDGGRIRLEPQKSWAVNNPAELDVVLEKLGKIQKEFNDSLFGNTKVSIADLVVIGGAAAIEKAAQEAGYDVTVPVKPGRADATPEQTDVASFELLKPNADGFRNYYDAKNTDDSPAKALIEKADLLDLTVPEMTVLVGGMRALNANYQGNEHGVFTDNPGTLSNDFFVNLLDMSTKWEKASEDGLYNGIDRQSGEQKWTATPVDLIFGSNSELRAVAEVYAYDESKDKFVNDFIAAWTKVMNLGR